MYEKKCFLKKHLFSIRAVLLSELFANFNKKKNLLLTVYLKLELTVIKIKKCLINQ